MTTRDYDSDANFFFLLLPYYRPSFLISAVLLSYLSDPLFSFCLFLCTFITAWPTQPGP